MTVSARPAPTIRAHFPQFRCRNWIGTLVRAGLNRWRGSVHARPSVVSGERDRRERRRSYLAVIEGRHSASAYLILHIFDGILREDGIEEVILSTHLTDLAARPYAEPDEKQRESVGQRTSRTSFP
jgi:hypothetical protein